MPEELFEMDWKGFAAEALKIVGYAMVGGAFTMLIEQTIEGVTGIDIPTSPEEVMKE